MSKKTWVVKMSTGSIYVTRPEAVTSAYFIHMLTRTFRNDFSIEPSGILGLYGSAHERGACDGAWLRPLED